MQTKRAILAEESKLPLQIWDGYFPEIYINIFEKSEIFIDKSRLSI